MDVQEAGDAARYYHSGSSQPTGTVMADGGRVQLEGGVCAGVEAELQRRGHTTYRGANGGGYQAIMRECGDVAGAGAGASAGAGAGASASGEGNGTAAGDCASWVYHGATELRKDGIAAGW